MVRITVVYEESRLNLDLNPADSIAVIKKAVREKMVVETVEDKKVAKYLEVTFSGAVLRDDWVIQDLAITSGTLLRCVLKIVKNPICMFFLLTKMKIFA